MYFKALLVADGRGSCPHIAKLHSDPRSVFFMYIHYMDIPCALLMPIAHPTAYVWHLLAA